MPVIVTISTFMQQIPIFKRNGLEKLGGTSIRNHETAFQRRYWQGRLFTERKPHSKSYCDRELESRSIDLVENQFRSYLGSESYYPRAGKAVFKGILEGRVEAIDDVQV